jgi:ligand-binding sensor domain-containing protein
MTRNARRVMVIYPRLFFICLLLGVLLNGLPGVLLAQRPAENESHPVISQFQHLTMREGLADNFATGITQDKSGFIWIGTVKGLTRFDGQHCRNFTREAGNPHSLSHRVVWSVLTARDGTLWVGTQRGINRYDPATQTFQRYSFERFGANSNIISKLVETSDGILWCGTKDGLIRFDPVSGQARYLGIPADSALRADANNIRALLPDGATLWVGTQAGLYAYRWRTNQVRAFRHHKSVPNSLPGEYVAALAQNSNTNELIVGTKNGYVAQLDKTTGVFRRLPLQAGNQAVASLLYTATGTLWVGLASGGLYQYHPHTNNFVVYLNEELNPRSLSCNCVKGLFEDRNGMVWIITDEGGVDWISPKTEKFHSVFEEVGYRPASAQALDASRLSFDKKNGLWVATHEGLLWVDPKRGTFKRYSHKLQNSPILLPDFLHTVLADSRGRVWAGGSGLARFDPMSNQFVPIPCLSAPDQAQCERRNFVAGDLVFSTIEHRDGRVLIGTNDKLTIYNPRTNTYANKFTDERIRLLPGKNYNTLYLDRHENLWVGGFGPVYKISPNWRVLNQFVHDENDLNSLPDEGVTGFAEDAAGYMWMATDNGLTRLDEKSGRFRTFTTQHGLPNNDIASVLITGDTLWVSTSRGLACVNTRLLRFTAFDEDDGLPPSGFESDAITRDSTGRIYFGNARGLVSVQPQAMRLNRLVPPIFLTSFRVDGREFLRGTLEDPTPIELSHTQYSFDFDMAALSFDNPAENQFAYRLEGFENRWNKVGNRPFASYTNVPPGEYVLHVIGANNDGVWNRQGYRLAISISPPFWQRWWFRIGVLALFLVGIVLTARWREKRLVREQNEKSDLRERIAASEMKALRSQMNPHFLYNSLNAIRSFVLQNDSDNADRYLVKFSRLMRLILENSRQEWVTLDSELDQLRLYLELEQLRFDHTFDFILDIDPAIDRENISIPPMIIQPYAENAILHGMAHKKSRGQISIRLIPLGAGLECRVEDNGVGRQKAAELRSKTVSSHKSMGLTVTQERLNLISQRDGKETMITVIDKVDAAKEPIGTTIVIPLPVKVV